MRRALAILCATTATMALAITGTASAACVAPYCPVPTASIGAATNVTDTSATLTGTVNPNGAGSTSYTFLVNGSTVATGTVGDSTSAGTVSASIAGLTPATSYTVTLTVSNAGGFANGGTQTFTTLTTAAAEASSSADSSTGGPGGSGSGGTTTETSNTPTTTPPAATAADKREAAATINDVTDRKATFEEQIGSALVYSLGKKTSSSGGSGSTPSGLFPIGVLALTSDSGATISTKVTFTLDNGKKVSVPSPKATIGPGGVLVIKVRLTKKQLRAFKAAGGGTASIKITVTDKYGTHTETVAIDVATP
jgi:hypothetical protein